MRRPSFYRTSYLARNDNPSVHLVCGHRDRLAVSVVDPWAWPAFACTNMPGTPAAAASVNGPTQTRTTTPCVDLAPQYGPFALKLLASRAARVGGLRAQAETEVQGQSTTGYSCRGARLVKPHPRASATRSPARVACNPRATPPRRQARTSRTGPAARTASHPTASTHEPRTPAPPAVRPPHPRARRPHPRRASACGG